MKWDMGVSDEIASLVLGFARTACVIAPEAGQNALICSLWWLEAMDCNENWHEGHRRCRQNDIVGFRVVCM